MANVFYIIVAILSLFIVLELYGGIRHRIGYNTRLSQIGDWIERHIRSGGHKCRLFLRHRKSGHCVEFYKWAPCIGLFGDRRQPSKYYLILREGRYCSPSEFSSACALLDEKSVDYELEEDGEERVLKADIGPDIELATDLATAIFRDCYSFSDVSLCACFSGGINLVGHFNYIAGWTDRVSLRAKHRNETERYSGSSSLHLGAKARGALSLSRFDVRYSREKDIDIRNEHGVSPLMTASYFGNYDAAAILLEEGASVRACDKTRRTALHLAAWKGHTDIVKLLLENDAPRGVEDKEGRTPLDLARENGHDDIVRLLSDKT